METPKQPSSHQTGSNSSGNRYGVSFSSPRVTPVTSYASPPPRKHDGSRRWCLEDFDVAKKIGEGRFGKVYLARERETKCAVVLKCLSKESLVRHEMQLQVQRECELQAYLKHKNIVRLLAFFWDEERIFLVLEYCEGGDLFTLLRKQPSQRFPESVVAGFVRDIATALHQCHSRGILHRDIKPENIFLRKGTAKLGDFTWAAQFDMKQKERRQTLCGTLDYLSPEVVGSRGSSPATDIWALGAVAFELLVGKPPFEDALPQDTCKRIGKGTFSIPGHLSPEAKDFLRSTLRPEESERLSALEILSHTWVSSAIHIRNSGERSSSSPVRPQLSNHQRQQVPSSVLFPAPESISLCSLVMSSPIARDPLLVVGGRGSNLGNQTTTATHHDRDEKTGTSNFLRELSTNNVGGGADGICRSNKKTRMSEYTSPERTTKKKVNQEEERHVKEDLFIDDGLPSDINCSAITTASEPALLDQPQRRIGQTSLVHRDTSTALFPHLEEESAIHQRHHQQNTESSITSKSDITNNPPLLLERMSTDIFVPEEASHANTDKSGDSNQTERRQQTTNATVPQQNPVKTSLAAANGGGGGVSTTALQLPSLDASSIDLDEDFGGELEFGEEERSGTRGVQQRMNEADEFGTLNSDDDIGLLPTAARPQEGSVATGPSTALLAAQRSGSTAIKRDQRPATMTGIVIASLGTLGPSPTNSLSPPSTFHSASSPSSAAQFSPNAGLGGISTTNGRPSSRGGGGVSPTSLVSVSASSISGMSSIHF